MMDYTGKTAEQRRPTTSQKTNVAAETGLIKLAFHRKCRQTVCPHFRRNNTHGKPPRESDSRM